jgi:hypothetical protein
MTALEALAALPWLFLNHWAALQQALEKSAALRALTLASCRPRGHGLLEDHADVLVAVLAVTAFACAACWAWVRTGPESSWANGTARRRR